MVFSQEFMEQVQPLGSCWLFAVFSHVILRIVKLSSDQNIRQHSFSSEQHPRAVCDCVMCNIN